MTPARMIEVRMNDTGRVATATTAHGGRRRAPTTPLRAHELAALEHAVADRDHLGVLHRSSELTPAARHTLGDRELYGRLDGLVEAGGAGALAGVEIIGALIGDEADIRLLRHLDGDQQLLRRHAGWRLGDRPPVTQAIPSLLRELRRGGIDTFHAHRTLRRWAAANPATVLRGAVTAFALADDPAARARVVDLVGAIDDRGTDAWLVGVAIDAAEHDTARIAAIGALAERPGARVDEALTTLARTDDVIAAHAALALQRVVARPRPGGDGLHVAQLVLAEGLDGQLSRGGRGETGGVASLLVSLGDELGSHPRIDHVTTIGRGTVTDALVGRLGDGGPWSYLTIPLGDDTRPVSSAADAWEHVPAVERGLRRALRSAGQVDLLHLRMADVGTLIGAEVAAAAGVATCFSLAPDPHNVIQSLQGRGGLDVDRFEQLDLDQHVWFRARLVEGLGRRADRVALFPRATSFPFLDAIVDDDIGTRDIGTRGIGTGRRTAVVAEGIDIAAVRRAERDADARTAPVVNELDARLGAGRRGRPLVVSVGRLHPVKGMDRVVEAWAGHPQLRDRCNLVIVGGDLDRPSPTERSVLERIDATLDRHPAARDGLVLLGGRPHADIARLLVSVRRGHDDAWAAGGIYVDGAMKEEFGLAVLEAMAAGLVVVAPSTGGPSTYVTPHDTGVLVDPGADLGPAIVEAFDLVDVPGRCERARRMIESRYSIGSMASQLVDLYL